MDPHQRYQKKYQAKIAQNDQIIAGQKLEIEQLKSQSGVLRRKRDLALKAIHEAAAKEEVELQRKLKVKREKLESGLKDLEEKKQNLEIEIQGLSRDCYQQETIKQELIGSIDELQKSKKSLELEIKDNERAKQQLSKKLESLRSQQNTLQESINASKDAQIESEKLLESVKSEIATVNGQLSIAQREFESKKSQMTREILDLDHQLNQKIAMLKEISGKDKEMRESLAKKQSELEKREEVIRRRESIVAVGEQKIKNNISMLKL